MTFQKTIFQITPNNMDYFMKKVFLIKKSKKKEGVREKYRIIKYHKK